MMVELQKKVKTFQCGLIGFGIGLLLSMAGYATELDWIWKAGFTIKCLALYIMVSKI